MNRKATGCSGGLRQLGAERAISRAFIASNELGGLDWVGLISTEESSRKEMIDLFKPIKEYD